MLRRRRYSASEVDHVVAGRIAAYVADVMDRVSKLIATAHDEQRQRDERIDQYIDVVTQAGTEPV